MKNSQYHFSLTFYNGEKLSFHCCKESITSAFIHLGKSLNLDGCKELHLKVDQTASKASGSYKPDGSSSEFFSQVNL